MKYSICTGRIEMCFFSFISTPPPVTMVKEFVDHEQVSSDDTQSTEGSYLNEK